MERGARPARTQLGRARRGVSAASGRPRRRCASVRKLRSASSVVRHPGSRCGNARRGSPCAQTRRRRSAWRWSACWRGAGRRRASARATQIVQSALASEVSSRITPTSAAMVRRSTCSSRVVMAAARGRGTRGAARSPRAAIGTRRRRYRRATRAPNTTASSSELEASRFAPCAPVEATSPQAHSPSTRAAPVRIGEDAAHVVVRRRRDRDRLSRRIDAGRAAGGEHGRESARRARRPSSRQSRKAPRPLATSR